MSHIASPSGSDFTFATLFGCPVSVERWEDHVRIETTSSSGKVAYWTYERQMCTLSGSGELHGFMANPTLGIVSQQGAVIFVG